MTGPEPEPSDHDDIQPGETHASADQPALAPMSQEAADPPDSADAVDPVDPADPADSGDPSPPDPASASAAPSSGVMSLFRFTIEGRRAPGLFVGGWIALLTGAGATFIGLLAGPTIAGVILFVLGMVVVLVALVLLGGSQAMERRAGGAAYAGPSPILTFLAVVVGWYLAAIVVLTPLQLLKVQIEGPALTLLGIGLQAMVVLLILRIMVVGAEALTWAEMGLRRPDRQALADFVSGALVAGPVVLVTAIAVALLVSIIGQQPASPLPPTGSSTGLLVNLLAGAIIAPVYEELFFRGFAQTAWLRMSGARAAIIRAATLFAFVHILDQSGDTFGAAFGIAIVAAGARVPVALALGYVFNRRGSLWASIGLHATFNAILLIVAERALSA